ncbi:MAG: endonuclease/exonuclease/phosphatase family protein [Planctomycetota bacterium]|nr:endonuclease/exonuclease/phosphatase family protein [Planctomycetota bacterium]
MILPSKKLATLASLVGGLAYLSQHYTIDGLRGLRIHPVSKTASQPANSTYPDSSGASFSDWEQPQSSASGPATSFPQTNSLTSWLPDIARSVATFTSSPNTLSPNASSQGFPGDIASQANSPLLPGDARSPITQQPTLPALRAPTLKIASFNLQRFGHHKVENPFVAETVIKVIRQFDVIALQEVCTQQQDLIAMLVDRVNQSGARYDYVIGPRIGNGDNLEQFAFVFNTKTIETDRDQLYSVEDPDNLLLREPLVGWFRAKQNDAHRAFTFTLVNVHIDSDRSDAEVRLLPELVQSIRRDGRDEDDTILAGDFGADALSMAYLRQRGFTVALNETPTLVSSSQTPDNLVFFSKATDEYIGRSGTLDFLRKSNLSIDQALQVSDHLPVWAEFSTVEGGAY